MKSWLKVLKLPKHLTLFNWLYLPSNAVNKVLGITDSFSKLASLKVLTKVRNALQQPKTI